MQIRSIRWHKWLNRRARPSAGEPPLRAELFSLEQLTRHAHTLATIHRQVTQPGPNRLLPRLDHNETVLRSFNQATLAVSPGRRITPAAEWLLDNFYLIEEQIQIARRHLPRGYSRELPRLLHGPSAGLPRVYDIVLELIAHVDAQVEAGPLGAFIASYQTVDSLKLGELWAVPIMLRLGLIENLQRITLRLAVAREDRDLADLWAQRLQEMAETNPSNLVIVVADMAESAPPLSSSFVAEFCQRLSRQSPVLHLARGWLEQRLAADGQSIEHLIQTENQNQAADQVSVSHSIASLRSLSALDWKEFVESHSLVEATLRGDPAAVYRRMDFATRDRYRHAVEFLARHSRQAEAEIARLAVRLAAENSQHCGPSARTAHVGYYLIDEGRPLLDQRARVRRPWRSRLERGFHRCPLLYFAGAISGLTVVLTTALVLLLQAGGMAGIPLLGCALVGLLCASQPAVALVNWLITLLLKPELLPRMDFSPGLSPDCRTLVVVPTILTFPAEIDRLIESLEIHHLANRDPHLQFALLTDFRDAPQETLPGDESLLLRARAGIVGLNTKYRSGTREPFFLLHRPRRWNASEGTWMGYERKRGKLTELNALLRGGARERFSLIVGPQASLRDVRYVITLDTDTQLPREAARLLVATMAHPLNQPVFDDVHGIVTRGYGILQPRVGVSLPGARRTWFVRLLAGDAGIDPYTRAVSDVYQDAFGEGSFIGKGIYEVDAFERALAGRCPENSILSHDLLESCHARSALVSDVELYEEFPSRYNVESERRHRWIRGDWQIARWLFPLVPTPGRGPQANPLSWLSQWKIFDNLRRSLVPLANLVFLLGSWLLLPAFSGRGTLLVLACLALPAILATLAVAGRKPADLPWALHGKAVAASLGRQGGQGFLTLAFLPHDAFISLDAIGRTLLRLLVTHRRLLEWRTSSDAEKKTHIGLGGFYVSMGFAPAVAVAAGALLAWLQPAPLPTALPLLGLWLAAPWVAWKISQPLVSTAPALAPAQREFLHRTARRTWNYFETFVTSRENWLPPDNYQEIPAPVIATRTSPTNLGLALLANLAARDLGYLSTGGLLRRTQDTLATMQRLERHRGHFYNWYDTRTLAPLLPLYVSSVDSGNLAGHLLTLGSGLREQADEKLSPAYGLNGLRDTLAVLRELVGENPALAGLAVDLAIEPRGLRAALALVSTALERINALAPSLARQGDDVLRWLAILERNCADHQADWLLLAPWLTLPAADRRHPLESHFVALDQPLTLRELADLPTPPGLLAAGAEAAQLARCLEAARAQARGRLRDLEALAKHCDELAAMDFAFLFDAHRKLFCTGYNVTECRRDSGHYDLLASEARLGSFVAIALGQIPQDHWFALGRLLVATHDSPLLVSWSGSMFEYLMPRLVMPNYENTLLDRTCTAAVAQQIAYGDLRGVPWGISESGYNLTDVHFNYQYRPFGVPGLGLKRGLAEDLVIAPYASTLALLVAPVAACQNLEQLASLGASGRFGFYEALDYTPSRRPPGEASVLLRSFMVHHQGMSLLALVHVLRAAPMSRRFLACPWLKAADLLLQERVPPSGARVRAEDMLLDEPPAPSGKTDDFLRVFFNPSSATPEVHLLSNGRYHVMVSSAGGGFSRWRDLALTRWREDSTQDCWGTFVYLRDALSGEFWSAAHQPTLGPIEGYEAIFTQARAEFRQQRTGLESHTEICVSPEDDVELRRLTLTNRTATTRVIELTSYAEVTLTPPEADAAHPAFSNLFVQTEFIPAASAVLCTRRPGSPEGKPPWLLHLLLAQGDTQGRISCETDRSRFVGRGGTLGNPAALHRVSPLSDTVGSVLDPIVALRRTVSLPPHATTTVVLVFGVTDSRETALALIDKYQSPRMADRAFDLAWTHSQVALRQLNATEREAQVYGRLAGPLLYANPAHRASPAVLRNNRRGQNGLWSYGISGDAPLVLLRICDPAKIDLVRQLLKAHAYWRLKGLAVELVILNEEVSVYRQSLHEQIIGLIAAGVEAPLLDKPGGIFVRRHEQVPADDRDLLNSVARLVLDDTTDTLAELLSRRGVPEPLVPPLSPTRSAAPAAAPALAARELIFANGLGGFTRDGHEYVITLPLGRMTPAPWVNVLANPSFGTVVSETGGAYTWVENAHEFRLTPWGNDPVQDTSGEAFYLRDEQTGQFWSPTPLPTRGAAPYVVRHGFGYTVYEHTENGLSSELWVYVAMDAPVKFMILKVRNLSTRPRRFSATGYWEWVLGDLRSRHLLHVQTEVDLKTGALLARNPYNTEFPERLVFLDVHEAARTVTGDRKEFIGRNGNLTRPAALGRSRLSGRVGAGLDPCGAIQVAFDLAEGQERTINFRLGVGRSPADVQTLIQRYRRADACHQALEGVWAHWNRTLGAVNVDTPDPAVNVLANGWLLYQTLSCRVWGRTGFYQSGGAYGFRDQLQDVMALVHAEPALTREHLLRAASRQFPEGDVQHWWHPPTGHGVRTNFSDDFLWLPFATCRYVDCLADTGVLAEPIPFLEARLVKPDEEAFYDLPNRTEETATLYQHCVRAIERGLRYGQHGLPLIGCGDWNDGMNRVGRAGRGESVWLAFFLYDVLTRFSGLARAHGDSSFAERCLDQARQLQENIELHAWDGAWYRRAFFDDGTPLGSAANPECQIDSLPQSWAVLSGAGEASRSRQAMAAVDQRLVRREAGLIQLFDPPFDQSSLNPGYVKGYIPGVRENGGQYTHGAIWTAMAFAHLGDSQRAWELFNLLNPVHHGSTPQRIATYKVEPYVVAADVYAVVPHLGRGGWTWYTGSAGWMYRLLIETLLGVNREGDALRLTPRLPDAWPAYKIHYRYRSSVYHITISRLDVSAPSDRRLVLDGVEIAGNLVPLLDDQREHAVEMHIR